jgi:cytochrome P450
MEKLVKEVSNCKDIDQLKLIELEKLPMLNAVIREVLRLYPPIPSPLGRVVPPGGTTLGNYYIPAGVS